MAVGVLDPRKGIVWQDDGSSLTPEQIEQLQALEVRRRMGGVDTSPVNHWSQGAARVVDALGGVLRERRLANAASENQAYNAGIVNELLGQSSPVASAATSGVSQELAATSPAPVVAEGEIADYIRQSATARGIDPDVALRVAMSEGGLKDPVRQSDYVKNGVREASYGPFQLYMGGGLGNKALEAGIDPRDPNQWRQGVDFALDQAAKGGWSPWYGAAKVGVGNRTGLDNARAIGFAPRSAPTPAAAAIETAAPASGYVDPVVSTPNAMPSAPVSSFDAGRFGEGAPVSAMPEVYSAQTDFAPPLPAPTTINPSPPVAAVPQQVAQAQPQTNPAAIAQALRVMADPRANEGTRRVAQALIQQEQQRQAAAQEQAVWQQRQEYERAQQASDPLRQAQIEKAQLELGQLRNPSPEFRQVSGDQARSMGLDPSKVYNVERNGKVTAIGGDGVTVNNNMGGDKFGEKLAELDAKALSDTAAAGAAAQRNIGRIDQLGALLEASPSGAEAALKQAAGEYGINTEGLSNIQAAQAVINSLVPEQRQPGSGPMSDADLALFKRSLPRLINQPGGNATIINTIRAIAQYDAEGARIVQRTRLPEDQGGISRAQAFDMLQNRPNPLSSFKAPAAGQESQGWSNVTTDIPGVTIRRKN